MKIFGHLKQRVLNLFPSSFMSSLFCNLEKIHLTYREHLRSLMEELNLFKHTGIKMIK